MTKTSVGCVGKVLACVVPIVLFLAVVGGGAWVGHGPFLFPRSTAPVDTHTHHQKHSGCTTSPFVPVWWSWCKAPVVSVCRWFSLGPSSRLSLGGLLPQQRSNGRVPTLDSFMVRSWVLVMWCGSARLAPLALACSRGPLALPGSPPCWFGRGGGLSVALLPSRLAEFSSLPTRTQRTCSQANKKAAGRPTAAPPPSCVLEKVLEGGRVRGARAQLSLCSFMLSSLPAFTDTHPTHKHSTPPHLAAAMADVKALCASLLERAKTAGLEIPGDETVNVVGVGEQRRREALIHTSSTHPPTHLHRTNAWRWARSS